MSNRILGYLTFEKWASFDSLNNCFIKKGTESTLSTIIKKSIRDGKTQGPTEKRELSVEKVNTKASTDIDSSLRSILSDINITKHNDKIKMVLNFHTITSKTGHQYEQFMAFDVSHKFSNHPSDIVKFIDELDFKSLTNDLKVEVLCKCSSFKYHFSKINRKDNSLYMGDYNSDPLTYTTKGGPSVNPDQLGSMCKHLLSDCIMLLNNFDGVKKKIRIFAEKFMKENTKMYSNLKQYKKQYDYDKLHVSDLENKLRERGIAFNMMDSRQSLINKLQQDDVSKGIPVGNANYPKMDINQLIAETKRRDDVEYEEGDTREDLIWKLYGSDYVKNPGRGQYKYDKLTEHNIKKEIDERNKTRPDDQKIVYVDGPDDRDDKGRLLALLYQDDYMRSHQISRTNDEFDKIQRETNVNKIINRAAHTKDDVNLKSLYDTLNMLTSHELRVHLEKRDIPFKTSDSKVGLIRTLVNNVLGDKEDGDWVSAIKDMKSKDVDKTNTSMITPKDNERKRQIHEKYASKKRKPQPQQQQQQPQPKTEEEIVEEELEKPIGEMMEDAKVNEEVIENDFDFDDEDFGIDDFDDEDFGIDDFDDEDFGIDEFDDEDFGIDDDEKAIDSLCKRNYSITEEMLLRCRNGYKY